MEVVLILLLIGLLFGVGGLVTAAKWLLIFMLIFWILGAISYNSYYHNHHGHRDHDPML